MSDSSTTTVSSETDLNSLYHTVLREMDDETAIMEVDPDMYKDISGFIGNLRKQEYDGTGKKIKNTLLEFITELTTVLLQLRLEKTVRLGGAIATNRLLDEEKFILDSEEMRSERQEMILSATLHGRSKLLESVSQRHKIRMVTVRLLKDVNEMVGVDLKGYGSFKAEDIATIPYENAQALITKGVATKVRWEEED